jgi:hypothetical protein
MPVLKIVRVSYNILPVISCNVAAWRDKSVIVPATAGRQAFKPCAGLCQIAEMIMQILYLYICQS